MGWNHQLDKVSSFIFLQRFQHYTIFTFFTHFVKIRPFKKCPFFPPTLNKSPKKIFPTNSVFFGPSEKPGWNRLLHSNGTKCIALRLRMLSLGWPNLRGIFFSGRNFLPSRLEIPKGKQAAKRSFWEGWRFWKKKQRNNSVKLRIKSFFSIHPWNLWLSLYFWAEKTLQNKVPGKQNTEKHCRISLGFGHLKTRLIYHKKPLKMKVLGAHGLFTIKSAWKALMILRSSMRSNLAGP